MDHERFRDWFSHVDDLTAPQRAEVAAALSERPQGAASLAAIELGVDDERRCHQQTGSIRKSLTSSRDAGYDTLG